MLMSLAEIATVAAVAMLLFTTFRNEKRLLQMQEEIDRLKHILSGYRG